MLTLKARKSVSYEEAGAREGRLLNKSGHSAQSKYRGRSATEVVREMGGILMYAPLLVNDTLTLRGNEKAIEFILYLRVTPML